MAIGKKTGGRDFVSGDPRRVDKPKLPEAYTMAKRFAKRDLDMILWEMMNETEERIKEIQKDPNTPGMKKAVAKLMLNAISKGDAQMIDYFCNRTIGKVKEELDISVHPKPMIIRRLDGSEVILTTDAELLDKDT